MAPDGQAETALAAIWQQVLGLERVGRNDNFFELGGHSLLAVQLMTRIRGQFGIDVALRTLFEFPQFGQFAEQLVALRLDQFSHDDIDTLEQELGSMTEEELLAMLAGD